MDIFRAGVLIEFHSSGYYGTNRVRVNQVPVNHFSCEKMYFKYSIYIIILLNSNNGLIKADNVRTYNIDDKVSGCSTWLSTIIYLFCDNTYKIVKRDTTSLMIEKIAPKNLQLGTINRRSHGNHKPRERRQVADECCARPCTVADIIMYCPNDAKLVRERPDIFESS